MKRWLIRVPVKAARGEQCYEVEAATEEAALKLWDDGDKRCVFVGDELEVTSLGEPEVSEIKEKS